MLRALLERDIVPDVVIGTSAGALNGAAVAYAPNLTGVAQLAAVWEQLQADHVFPGGRIHRAWNIVRRGTHLFDNDGLAALIHHSHAGPLVLRSRDPAARDRDRPRHRRGGRARARTAEARAAREHRAAGRLPDRACTTGAGSSTAAWSNNVPLWHALVGPGRPRLRAERVVGRRRPRRALAARRGDDELHARAQPALRARARGMPIEHVDVIDAPAPARPARPLRLLRRARADRGGLHALDGEARQVRTGAGRDARGGGRGGRRRRGPVREQRRRFRLRRGA